MSERIEVSNVCPITKKSWSVWVHPQDKKNWENGYLVQVAFPYLTPGEREMFISGISTEGWDLISPEGNEEGEEDA